MARRICHTLSKRRSTVAALSLFVAFVPSNKYSNTNKGLDFEDPSSSNCQILSQLDQVRFNQEVFERVRSGLSTTSVTSSAVIDDRMTEQILDIVRTSLVESSITTYRDQQLRALDNNTESRRTSMAAISDHAGTDEGSLAVSPTIVIGATRTHDSSFANRAIRPLQVPNNNAGSRRTSLAVVSDHTGTEEGSITLSPTTNVAAASTHNSSFADPPPGPLHSANNSAVWSDSACTSNDPRPSKSPPSDVPSSSSASIQREPTTPVHEDGESSMLQQKSASADHGDAIDAVSLYSDSDLFTSMLEEHAWNLYPMSGWGET